MAIPSGYLRFIVAIALLFFLQQYYSIIAIIALISIRRGGEDFEFFGAHFQKGGDAGGSLPKLAARSQKPKIKIQKQEMGK